METNDAPSLTAAIRTFDPTLGTRNIPQIFFWGAVFMIFYFLNEKMGETHMEEHKQKVYFTEPTC